MKELILRPKQLPAREPPPQPQFQPPYVPNMGAFNWPMRIGYRSYRRNVEDATAAMRAQMSLVYDYHDSKMNLEKKRNDIDYEGQMRIHELREAEAKAERAWQLAEQARLQAMEAQLRYQEALEDYNSRRSET